jgi:hypothetical protein
VVSRVGVLQDYEEVAGLQIKAWLWRERLQLPEDKVLEGEEVRGSGCQVDFLGL